MKKIIMIAALALFPNFVWAADAQMYKLDNGQTVVIQEVRNNPIVIIDTWIKTLYESGEKPEVVVAINKFDLINDKIDEVDKLTKTFENKYDSFYFCSAKSGYNVKELFDTENDFFFIL